MVAPNKPQRKPLPVVPELTAKLDSWLARLEELTLELCDDPDAQTGKGMKDIRLTSLTLALTDVLANAEDGRWLRMGLIPNAIMVGVPDIQQAPWTSTNPKARLKKEGK